MKTKTLLRLLVCLMLCTCVILLASCRGGVTVKPDGDGGVTITPDSGDGEDNEDNEEDNFNNENGELRPFKEFSDVNTKNSFLGYGIDIINASNISSKNVLMTYPIFDMGKLQDEMLLYTNDHYNSFQAIEGETIQTFVENMSNSTSVSAGSSVSAKGQIKGVDVGASVSMSGGLSTAFTKTSSSVKSQYFLEIIGENQTYWLILQSSEDRYKQILSDEFKKDLYSDMSAEQLFRKYGTHLLTSVAMGGSVSMYYTMYSYDEAEMSSKYAKVSAEIKQNVNAAYGKYSGSVDTQQSFENTFTYSRTATEYGILIDERIFCSGGGAFGINNATTLYDNYDEWQKSLDYYPVVMGIKDSNSLYPIWDLIDLSIDGAKERRQELYDYFIEYGVGSLNELYETYDIAPVVVPEGITNIRINGQAYNEGSMPQTKAGSTVRITFDPTPANANMYKKVYSVYSTSDTDEYKVATIDEMGVLKVADNAPSGTYLTVTVSAGTVSEQIVFYIMNSYNVNFMTGVAGFDVAPMIGVLEGSKIDEPNISREGWKLEGWYRDPGYTQPYNFNIDRITSHTTLYAKLYEIKPVVSFDTLGGSKVSSSTVAYRGKVSIPNNPNKAGYVFDGWFMDIEHTVPFNFETEILVDTVVYAKWNRIEYTVRFETNGGTPVTSAITSIDDDYKISEPKTERALYTFKGWYMDKEYTNLFYFGSQITEDMTLYAKWEEKIFTVSYFVDGKVYNSQTYKFGQTINYLEWPSIDGKQFSGWIWTGGILPETMPAEDITLEGSFDQVLFEVKYYIDNVCVDTQKVYRGHTIPNNESLTIKVGHTFSGWLLRDDSGYATKPNLMPNNDIVLYGSFEANVHTIEFAGCNVPSITATYGTIITSPDNPVRIGYTFKSWDKKIPPTMPDEDMIITAQWVNNQYSVNYDLNSSELKGAFFTTGNVNVLVYDSTSVINSASSFYGEYYTFEGWYTERVGGTKIALANGQLSKNISGYTDSEGRWIKSEDITLYAHWSQTRPGYTYIDTPKELQEIESDGEYLIIKDLDLEGITWTPIESFAGVLDGDKHSIYNFTINATGKGSIDVALIANNSGIITNLTIGKIDVHKYETTYSVKYNVEYKEGGGVSRANVSGFVAHNNDDGVVSNCHLVNVYIKAIFRDTNNNEHLYLDVGGIVSGNHGTVENCSVESSYIYAEATASTDGGDNNYVWLGGIAAANRGTIANSKVANNEFTIKLFGDGTPTNKAYPWGAFGHIVGEQFEGVTRDSIQVHNTLNKHVTSTSNTKGTLKIGDLCGMKTGGTVS